MLNAAVCPICSSNSLQILCVRREIPYICCKSCNHAFAAPKDPEEKAPVKKGQSHYMAPAKQSWDYSELKAKFLYDKRLSAIESLVSRGKLLDIGCSTGSFIFTAKKRGWDASGVEIIMDHISAAQSRGLTVLPGPVENLSLPADTFSAITLWQVLEHIPNPISLLKEIFRILKPGGILALTTPNIRSIGWRILHEKWPAIEPENHFHLFSGLSLTTVTRNTGFSSCKLSAIDIQPSSIKVAINSMKGAGSDKSLNVVASIVSDASSFKIRALFAVRKILNIPLSLLNLGEDWYGIFKKP